MTSHNKSVPPPEELKGSFSASEMLIWTEENARLLSEPTRGRLSAEKLRSTSETNAGSIEYGHGDITTGLVKAVNGRTNIR